MKTKRTKKNFLKKTIIIIIIGTISTILIEFLGSSVSKAWKYSFIFYNFKFDFWFSIAGYLTFIPVVSELYLFLSKGVHENNKTKINLNIPLLLVSSFILIPIVWKPNQFQGLPFCFAMVGIMSLFDYINKKITKKSILENIISYPKNILKIILTSIIVAISSEYTNISQYVWRYTNLPFITFELFGVSPIIIMGWIPLTIMWLTINEIAKHISESTK